MSVRLDTPSRRIALAIGVSLLLHSLVLWGPSIHLPSFGSSLPPLQARLEALPAAPAKPKPKRKPKPAAPKPAPEPVAETSTPEQENPQPASAPVAAASEKAEEAETDARHEDERPPLPKNAQLTYDINLGESHFRIGEAVHTLEIKDGRYVLNARTTTTGITKLFKSYELNQYSNGTYGKYGLQPELFLDERKDRVGTQRDAVEFDHDAKLARFSDGREAPLPPDTQDILSIMYQFPPLKGVEVAPVTVTNGKKIEHYDFSIATNEMIDTPLGKLLTVHLRKLHKVNEEGLDIWLAQEYRLFPVKIRFTERNGEVAGEAVITDMRVSEEQGERKDVAN